MKKALAVILMLAAIVCMTSTVTAQYEMSKSYLGPRLGIGVNGSSLAFGAGYEYGLTKEISIGGLVDYYQYTYDAFAGYGGKYTYIVIGAQGNYHFGPTLKWDSKLDPFAGIVLGYESISWKWDNSAYNGYGWSAAASGIVFGGQAGIRYFLSPNLALYGQVGFGITYLKAGVDFKF